MRSLATRLTSLTCLLLAVSSAPADVVIYKGTLALKGVVDANAGYPATFGQYLFVDYSTHEVLSLIYYTKQGTKLGVLGSYLFDFIQAPFAAGKPGRVLVASEDRMSGMGFQIHGLTEYRGVQVPIVVRKIPMVITLTEPKSLTHLDHMASTKGVFSATEGLVTFQSQATLDANAVGQTVTTARQKFADDLTHKGYNVQ